MSNGCWTTGDRLSISETGGSLPVVLNNGTVDRVVDAIMGPKQPLKLSAQLLVVRTFAVEEYPTSLSR